MTDFLDQTGEIPRADSSGPPPPGPGYRPPAMMAVPKRRTPFKSVKAAGVARSVNMRSETFGQGASRQVLTFRLEQYDDNGNRMTPLPVEMRVLSLMGQLSEGEQVMVRGRWRHGVIRVRRIHNLSTGAVITAPFRSRSFKWMLWPLSLAVLIVVGIFVAGVVRDGADSIDGANPLESILSTPSVPSIPVGNPGPGPEPGPPTPAPEPPPQVLPPPPTPTQAAVEIKDNALPTTSPVLASGGELVINNYDGVVHNVEIPALGSASYRVEAYSQLSVGFVRLPTGTYDIICLSCSAGGNHALLDVR
jgi:hypothetical protein